LIGDFDFQEKGQTMGLAWQQGPLAAGSVGHFLTGLEAIGVVRLDATGRASGSEGLRYADVARPRS
jgi:hypothetical protein